MHQPCPRDGLCLSVLGHPLLFFDHQGQPTLGHPVPHRLARPITGETAHAPTFVGVLLKFLDDVHDDLTQNVTSASKNWRLNDNVPEERSRSLFMITKKWTEQTSETNI